MPEKVKEEKSPSGVEGGGSIVNPIPSNQLQSNLQDKVKEELLDGVEGEGSGTDLIPPSQSQPSLPGTIKKEKSPDDFKDEGSEVNPIPSNQLKRKRATTSKASQSPTLIRSIFMWSRRGIYPQILRREKSVD